MAKARMNSLIPREVTITQSLICSITPGETIRYPIIATVFRGIIQGKLIPPSAWRKIPMSAWFQQSFNKKQKWYGSYT